MRRRLKWLAWTAVGLVAVFEAAVLYLIATPRVSDDYRAFYIERASNCWPAGASGEVELGRRISFLKADARGPAAKLRECGWVVSGNGTWSEGPEARLRLMFPAALGPLDLEFELLAHLTEGRPEQHVDLGVDGMALTTLTLDADSPRRQVIRLPATATADGAATLSMRFPGAVAPRELEGRDDDRRWTIRLIFLTVRPAASDEG
jgi:hypothetical protein